MQEENFIVRDPLLNPEQRVLGYELLWQHRSHGGALTAEDAQALAAFVASQLNGAGAEALLGDQTLFIETLPELLDDEPVRALPAQGTVLALHAGSLQSVNSMAAVRAARANGYGISLRGMDVAADKTLLEVATHVEVHADSPDFAAQVQALRSLGPRNLKVVVRKVDNWKMYDACAKLDLCTFVEQLHLTPRPGTRSPELNPAQAMILQLMDMVGKNADIKQLEGVLKRDAALSYKLLRYINSAGFGLGCEIQSLKHAVTMLGYSPLYRWLALLLATATTTGYSPILMQTAVIRGRFAELLGHGLLPKSEAENLFVAGMFSLLDKLLGRPMDEVLEKIQLSESVSQALLTREGIYGPFLALAEACELNSEEVEPMSTSLCLSADQVNQAHMSALAWAQSLKL